MLSEGVGYSWGFIVVAMYGGMTTCLLFGVLLVYHIQTGG